MKQKHYLILLILIMSFNGHSQEQPSFTFDLGLSQNYKGFFTLYKGVIDAGAGYNHKIIGNLNAGATFHLGYLKRSNTSSGTIIYKPKINVHYNLMITPKIYLTLLAAFGYSFVSLSNKEYDYQETQQGINPGAELRVSWRTPRKTDFYIFGRYDYIYMAKDETFTQLEYYRQIHLSSFGLGIKVKHSE